MNKKSYDIGIITVIGKEMQALKDSLNIESNDMYPSNGSLFYEKIITPKKNPKIKINIVMYCVGEAGNEATASATSTLIERYQPKMVVLMGIAAGTRGKCKIGDVFVPRVVAFEGTNVQIAGELKGRPEIFTPPYLTNQMLANFEINKTSWWESFHAIFIDDVKAPSGKSKEYKEHVCKNPLLHDSALSSANVLIKDPERLLTLGEKLHQQIRIGDMEAGGFVKAARQRHPETPWMIVRAVSDFGDELKNDLFHRMASCAAASYLKEFIYYIYEPSLLENEPQSNAENVKSSQLPIPSLPPPNGFLNEDQRKVLADFRSRPIVTPLDLIAHLYSRRRVEHMGGDESEDHASFVNLVIVPSPGSRHDSKPCEYESLPEMLVDKSIRKEEREPIWQLRGEPGAGKSTLLFDLQLRSAWNVLYAWGNESSPKLLPELCLHFPLYGVNFGQNFDIAAWIEETWQRQITPWIHAHAGNSEQCTVTALRKYVKIRFLLDGLNEVTFTGIARQQAMNRFADWAHDEIDADRPAPIFTVRTLNWLPFHQKAGCTLVADVEPWQEEKIREYCARRFSSEVQRNAADEDERFGPLWLAIARHSHKSELVQLLGNPFNLAAQCMLFAYSGRELATNRAELVGRLGFLRLYNATLLRPDIAIKHPYLRLYGDDADQNLRTLALFFERRPPMQIAALHRLPIDSPLLSDLQDLAWAIQLQSEGGWGELNANETTLSIHGERMKQLSSSLQAAEALQLMINIQTDRGTRHRFSHQLWQEYFAACILSQFVDLRGELSSKIDLREFPQEELCNQELRNIWELPLPQPNPWEQCVQMAAQIAKDPEHLLDYLTEINLALAARSALGRVSELSSERIQILRQHLLKRSINPSTPTSQRVEAGDLLGRLGDSIRYEVLMSRNGHHVRVPKMGSHYWVTIPQGKHVIGGLDDQLNALNELEVTIAADVKIAFAPVTNAEFRCFVEAGGYDAIDADTPPIWWKGEMAVAWWRGLIRNEGVRNEWRVIRNEWLRSDESHDQVKNNWMGEFSLDDIERKIVPVMRPGLAGAKEFAKFVKKQSSPKRHRHPEWWQSSRHNQSLQPVVGVSWFEAQAYCAWLTDQIAEDGMQFRLPTEAEWEALARGGNGNAESPSPRGPHWPGIDKNGPSPGLVNNQDMRLRRCTPIGCFPSSNVDGVCDLIGNIWEWTCSAYTPGGLDSKALLHIVDSPGISKNQLLSVRGGSWFLPVTTCRAAFRDSDPASSRYMDLGFRLIYCRSNYSEVNNTSKVI